MCVISGNLCLVSHRYRLSHCALVKYRCPQAVLLQRGEFSVLQSSQTNDRLPGQRGQGTPSLQLYTVCLVSLHPITSRLKTFCPYHTWSHVCTSFFILFYFYPHSGVHSAASNSLLLHMHVRRDFLGSNCGSVGWVGRAVGYKPQGCSPQFLAKCQSVPG